MRKVVVSIMVVLFISMLSIGFSLAEFDFSVFDDNDLFLVTRDKMDDSIFIFSKEDSPFSKFISSKFQVLANIGIQGTERKNFEMAGLLFDFLITDVSPKIKQVIFLVEDTRYTVEKIISMPSQVDYGSPTYEVARVVCGPILFEMLDNIIENKITSIECRLVGNINIDGEIIVDVDSLKVIVDAYKAGGGLSQDLLKDVENAFPVTVKHF